MKRLIVLIFLFTFARLSGQDTTYYGDRVFTIDTMRVLNIFINIIYDIDSSLDPCKEITPNWIPGPPNSVNESLPVYLDDFMDGDYNPDNIHGTFTKRYAEASFKKFIVLGDHVVVNIQQSSLDTAGFGQRELLDSCVSLINRHGGLQTKNGHDRISDYDGCYTLNNILMKFQRKPQHVMNNQIDFIQVFLRNSNEKYGGMDREGRASITMHKALLMGNDFYLNDAGTVMGQIGNTDLSEPECTFSDVHELAHNLFGMTNAVHMGGGGPFNQGSLVTLEFNQGGWSLIGSANSSLVSCNGFERWRLDWKPSGCRYSIFAQNADNRIIPSDIIKSDTVKTFYLRDFITYGDAVRIKIPYTDAGALNQYIWLENHRLQSDKEDYPAYWKRACKDDGVPGIYAYYQVGKDIRTGSGKAISPSLTDNLIPICADGNWDIVLGQAGNLSCVAFGSVNVQEFSKENPFSGYNDLQEHFFNSIHGDTINWKNHRHQFILRLQDDQLTDKLTSLGDNHDPFTGISSINLSTNPAPVNVVTYHHIRPDKSGKIYSSSWLVNNRKIHLSGLRIDFTQQTDSRMKVDVRWNDYEVTKDVRWTGDIVLHDKVDLTSGNTITFDQNNTPDKHIRDSVTGVFAGPTYFTCLNSSTFTMQSSSQVDLQNLSSFILESGSKLTIHDSAIFTVKSGCTLQIKSGATLDIFGSGRIEVDSGGYLCIENGAGIRLNDNVSSIILCPGYEWRVNTSVITDSGMCITSATGVHYMGSGSIHTTN